MRTQTSRRWLLRGIGAGAVTTLAGCMGNLTNSGGPKGDQPAAEKPAAGETSLLAEPTLGDLNAPVVIEAYTDYMCGHCSTFHLDTLPRVKAKYLSTGDVYYVHRDFPIPLNEWSWNVALAGRSVQANEGMETFFAFTEAAYEEQANMNWATIEQVARSVGADGKKIVAEAKDGVHRPTVKADRQSGIDRGVRGTPTFFVNGEELVPEKSWWYTVDTGLQAALNE
ncbi:DsbA family protein [Haloarchaeobius sp. HME9146]|uniref:DsbA family protein n=1 Tax=Haloarchaeobius sp. HME9146 TaxID=2978732 RepID=UPI0021BE0BC1|nr:DsbA family protein [Haloarchaeobius sp. HME9146]MCT9097403.1 DsbA family protein [Haloarchaeobius sp. HME9146]